MSIGKGLIFFTTLILNAIYIFIVIVGHFIIHLPDNIFFKVLVSIFILNIGLVIVYILKLEE